MERVKEEISIDVITTNNFIWSEAREIKEALEQIRAIAQEYELPELDDLCNIIDDKRLNVQLLTTVIEELTEARAAKSNTGGGAE
jgi:hypothetical protein